MFDRSDVTTRKQGRVLVLALLAFIEASCTLGPQERCRVTCPELGQERLENRLEEYSPTREELLSKGAPVLVERGDDYFAVVVRGDYYYVIAFNVGGDRPYTAWRGARLPEELQESRRTGAPQGAVPQDR